MYDLWSMKITYLHHVSQVHYQLSRNGDNIDPLILIEDLKATYLVLQKNSEECIIAVFGKAQCQIWFRVCWIVMAQNKKSLNTAHVFEVVGFETQSFWQQLGYSEP